MLLIAFAILLVRLVIALSPALQQLLQILWQQTKQVLRKKKTVGLFDDYFIEAKAFYFYQFKQLPSFAFIGNVDSAAIFKLIDAGKYGKVKNVYQRNFYNHQQERIEFSKTLFVLENFMMVKLGDDWVEILHHNEDYDRAKKMMNDFKEMKAPQKEDDYEINIFL